MTERIERGECVECHRSFGEFGVVCCCDYQTIFTENPDTATHVDGFCRQCCSCPGAVRARQPIKDLTFDLVWRTHSQVLKETWYVCAAFRLMGEQDLSDAACILHRHPVAALQEMRRRERLEAE